MPDPNDALLEADAREQEYAANLVSERDAPRDDTDDADYAETDIPNVTNNDVIARQTHAWAEAAFWVSENIGSRMTREKAGNALRWAMWKVANKNQETFFLQILPKAMMILDKVLDKRGDDDLMLREERKEIGKLKRVLADALVESARA